MQQERMSERRILLGYSADVFGPLAAWWMARWLGISVFWGLALGTGIALVSTVINTARRGKMDAVGGLVLLEMTASMGMLFWLHSPRMLLIRPSFYSGIAAVYLMASAFKAKPLTLEGSKPFATKGDPVRTAAWERAWKDLPQFRMAHRMMTFGFGVALMVDAVLRVMVVYRYPVDRAAWLSNLPHMAAIGIIVIVSALFGRWAGGLVDEVQREMNAEKAAQ